MKITQSTLSILKNFSQINQSIRIQPGSVIKTRKTATYAEYVSSTEAFDQEFSIYDLNRFLNVVSLFKDPEFTFEERRLKIDESDGSASTLYGYAGEGLAELKMKNKITIPDDVIEFVLPEERLASITKAISVFQKPQVSITSDGDEIRISTEDSSQKSNDSFSLQLLGNPNGHKCKQIFSFSDLTLLRGSYIGTITKSFTKFELTNGPSLFYIVAPDPSHSTFTV